jgi:membrane protein
LQHYLHVRLTSLAVVLAASAMLLVASLVASTMIAAVRRVLGEGYAGQGSTWRPVGVVMLWLAIAILIALVHRFIPDARVPWTSAAAGTLATTGFFVLGRTLVGLFIRRAGVGSAYGAAGSLVVVVVWIYYSYLSLLYGAEVAKVWSRRPR